MIRFSKTMRAISNQVSIGKAEMTRTQIRCRIVSEMDKECQSWPVLSSHPKGSVRLSVCLSACNDVPCLLSRDILKLPSVCLSVYWCVLTMHPLVPSVYSGPIVHASIMYPVYCLAISPSTFLASLPLEPIRVSIPSTINLLLQSHIFCLFFGPWLSVTVLCLSSFPTLSFLNFSGFVTLS